MSEIFQVWEVSYAVFLFYKKLYKQLLRTETEKPRKN